ncbi:hypothetical protein ACLMJK_009544 [Lecanora helva]
MSDHPSSFPIDTAGEDDSEWEYEYHETETEDFYVVLDLSSASKEGPQQNRKHRITNIHSTSKGGLITHLTKNTAAANPQPNVSTQQEIMPDGEDSIMTRSNRDQAAAAEPQDQIQILDLHSSNPIISYQDQTYSCEWTSTIGTDVILSATNPDFPHPVLAEGEGVSIIATTGVRLLGRPAKLSARPSASARNEIDDPPQPLAPETSIIPTTEASPSTPPNQKPKSKQATFLSLLAAAKTEKAETDSVKISSQKKPGLRRNPKASSKLRDQADQTVAEDSSDTADNNDNNEATQPAPRSRASSTRGRNTPRGRKSGGRKSGPRTAKGGLFRDYRPQSTDTVGADIRHDPSTTSIPTPGSWDDLYVWPSASTSTPLIQQNPAPQANTIPHPQQASPPKTVPSSHYPHPPPQPQNPDTHPTQDPTLQDPPSPLPPPHPAPTPSSTTSHSHPHSHNSSPSPRPSSAASARGAGASNSPPAGAGARRRRSGRDDGGEIGGGVGREGMRSGNGGGEGVEDDGVGGGVGSGSGEGERDGDVEMADG